MLEQILTQIYPLNEYNVILANGNFPTNSYLISLIHQAKTVICCDGAVTKLLKHTIYPNHIIGDCDTLTKEIRQYFADQIITIPDQNTNDLTKAVHFAYHTLHLDNIIVLGATGLREDHSIANIALLGEYIKIINDIAIISDYGIFNAHSKPVQLKTIPGQQISFFTLNHSTTINCNELKWQLNNFNLTSWYQGTLNEAVADIINLEISDTVIIFRSFEIKTNSEVTAVI
ncbi:MAG: thiamine pyrophosphokinae [Pseudomonadota bacterium]|nr:thiamine pyrophosphokinae [Pseudomonadota bacterium]